MTIEEICNLPVLTLACENCHLWLWATNRSLHDAFHVMQSWGFKYLNIITWVKPAGVGPWFVNKTQHLLFGYRGKLSMGEGRYAPTAQKFVPKKHSKKPEESYELIESISFSPNLELFAREKREGWDVWGDEVDNDIAWE
jgi:N6-adenosine-specific RNA methylase IME4